MEGRCSNRNGGDAIKHPVEERPGKLAPRPTPCCTPPETVEALEKLGYRRDEIAELPASVTCASGGCGNPVAVAALKEGDVVVDLGCGAGLDCFLAAKRVGPRGKVIGVTNSSDHLAQANENKRKVGAQNVEFRLGNLEDMPVEDESVDLAVSNCVGIVMRGEGSVLRETRRVLKPGGRLVVTAGPDLDAKLRAAGFEVASRSRNIVTARKPPACKVVERR